MQGIRTENLVKIYIKRRFVDDISIEKKRRKEIIAGLAPISGVTNSSFSAFHKVSHCTDATDWRIEYPAVVVFPRSIKEIPLLVEKAQELNLKIIARGGGTGVWTMTKDDDLYQGAQREPHDPEGSDACKDCCSLIFGAFTLTGLVAVLAPMLAHKIRRGKNGYSEANY